MNLSELMRPNRLQRNLETIPKWHMSNLITPFLPSFPQNSLIELPRTVNCCVHNVSEDLKVNKSVYIA